MNESKKRVTDLFLPVNATPKEIQKFLKWIWTGCKNKLGYGRAAFRNTVIKAHRLSWAIHNGPIPKSTPDVLHNCPNGDNPSCVNPIHLWLGTQAQNMRDAAEKGRMAVGERHKSQTHPETVLKGSAHPLSKFTESQVRDIRFRIANGELVTHIAKEYNVWHGAISHIKNRTRWAHVS